MNRNSMNRNTTAKNTFSKKAFIKAVREKLRGLFMQEVETAGQEQLFRAVCAVIMEMIAEDLIKTQKAVKAQDGKTVYYLSMEFLVGRALGNDLLNLGARGKVAEALEELGIDLNALEDMEADPALGNGGLGRLAACILESLSTLGFSAVGCCIRYRHGLFRQKIVNGFQNELPDDWMDGGYPFEVRRPDEALVVRFGGFVRPVWNERKSAYDFIHKGGITVLAVPYDIPVIGYKNRHVNMLRLWDAEAITSDDLDYAAVMEQRRQAEEICGVLYPNDTTYEGKELRLKQQYFFVSASVRYAIAKYKKDHSDITKLPEKVFFQLNDTHPAVTIPELMRILMDEEGLGWDDAWAVTTECLAYTNHSVMIETMEIWPKDLFRSLLPRVFQIIEEIDRRFVLDLRNRYPYNPEKVSRMAIIKDGSIRMANLCIVAALSVNGVAKLHTEILKTQLFSDFYEVMPHKFLNITNGVSHRRFLLHGNPLLARWITGYIGPDWLTDLSVISKMASYADDEKVLQELMEIKLRNKERLAGYILAHNGLVVDPHSIFDVQVKRQHEYKRQLLCILYVIYLYDRIREDPENDRFYPRTFIFAGKAASSYRMAKLILKLINSVADVVNNDPSVAGRLKVVFIEDYRVSNAELIFAAADVSEQISTSGREASGTGVLKMQMCAAVLLGTMDGANVEVVEQVGPENAFIFGLSKDEVRRCEQNGGYDPRAVLRSDSEIDRALTHIIDGTFSADRSLFREIYDSLLTGEDGRPDRYFVLADLRSYIEAQRRVDAAYRDRKRWAKMALLNMANSGLFTSDRTVSEYVDRIWKLDKIVPDP